MTEEEFIIARDKLISDIRSSSLYCEYKKLDGELYTNPQICELNKIKDELSQEYKFAPEEKKDEYLAKIVQIQKQIDEKPLVKQYYKVKTELQKLVEPLNEEIIKKLYL